MRDNHSTNPTGTWTDDISLCVLTTPTRLWVVGAGWRERERAREREREREGRGRGRGREREREREGERERGNILCLHLFFVDNLFGIVYVFCFKTNWGGGGGEGRVRE